MEAMNNRGRTLLSYSQTCLCHRSEYVSARIGLQSGLTVRGVRIGRDREDMYMNHSCSKKSAFHALDIIFAKCRTQRPELCLAKSSTEQEYLRRTTEFPTNYIL